MMKYAQVALSVIFLLAMWGVFDEPAHAWRGSRSRSSSSSSSRSSSSYRSSRSSIRRSSSGRTTFSSRNRSWGSSRQKRSRNNWSGSRVTTSRVRSVSQKSTAPRNLAPSWNKRRQKSSTSRSKAASSPKRSAADQKLYERAKANGTLHRNKDQAVSAFKQKHANQYPSRYKEQPAKRPSHIPEKTRVDNREYDVTYRADRGGYGYERAGRWIYYDAMVDAAMLSALMSRHNYYYDPHYYDAPHVYHSRADYYSSRPVVVHHQRSGSGGWICAMSFVVLLVIVCVVIVVANRETSPALS